MNDIRIVDRLPSAGWIAVSYAYRVPPRRRVRLSMQNARSRALRRPCAICWPTPLALRTTSGTRTWSATRRPW